MDKSKKSQRGKKASVNDGKKTSVSEVKKKETAEEGLGEAGKVRDTM